MFSMFSPCLKMFSARETAEAMTLMALPKRMTAPAIFGAYSAAKLRAARPTDMAALQTVLMPELMALPRLLQKPIFFSFQMGEVGG